MTRASLAVGAVLAAVLTIGTAHAAPQAATVGRYSTIEAAAPMTADQSYVATIRRLSGVTASNLSNGDIVEGGKKVCSDIAAGGTWSQWRPLVEQAGVDPSMFHRGLSAAVNTYCPDSYRALLD